jgi:hypothetical protein
MARFCVGDVYFTVITSHLAAHEGLTYRERRNADMRGILRATSAVGYRRHPTGAILQKPALSCPRRGRNIYFKRMSAHS